MTDFIRDQNHVPVSGGVSSTDATVTVPFTVDPLTGRLLVDVAAAGGDVSGPASSTDNAIVRFDGITGKLIQDSTVTISDLGAIAGTTSITPAANDGGALGSSTLSYADLFLADGGVINFNNGNVTMTHSAGSIVISGSANAALSVTAPAGSTGAIIANGVTSGTAFNANSITNGTGLAINGLTTGTGVSVSSLTTGTGISLGGTSVTTGSGITFNTTAAAITTGKAINITGSASSTVDYTGAFITVTPTRNNTQAVTRTHSGNIVNITPIYSTSGTNSTDHKITGATAVIARSLSSGASGATASMTVSGSLLQLVNTKTLETSTLTDTGILLDIQQNNTTASGTVVKIVGTGTGLPFHVLNQQDAASVNISKLEGDRATPAANDEIYESFFLSSSTGVQREFGRITTVGTTVANASEVGELRFSTMVAGTLTTKLGLNGTALSPTTSDGLALGTASLMWSDLFLASGSVINWNNGDLTLTHASNLLTLAGGQFNFGANTAYFTETDNGNSSTADTIDWTLSNKQKSTLTGNVTYTFTAPGGPCSLVLKILTGAGSFTVTWPAAVKWAGGVAPTITTTASRMDLITFYYDGTNYWGNYSQNYTP